jgi:allantoicase
VTGFDGSIDLGARRLGGMVLEATDEFFAPKESLLDPRAPAFDPASYSDRGKIMDGWETRRRRGDGDDSCVVRLGVPGVVTAVEVDTTHFRGNAPEACWLEGCAVEPTGEGGSAPSPPDADTAWFPLLARTPVQPDAVQRFAVAATPRASHVRFWISPDGGVARLRLFGRPLVDLHAAAFTDGYVDLAAAVHGGRVVACTDAFFSSPSNLLTIGDARDMSDGWETRRRRGPGEDRVVVALATTGAVDRVELDTTHFKGNHPDRVVIEGLHAPDAGTTTLDDAEWAELVAATPTQPHARHAWPTADLGPVSHLRLRVLPDGGVARLRAFGWIDDEGWRRHGIARLDTSTPARLETDLLACCGSTTWARRMVACAPFGTPDALLAAADDIWATLGRDDRLEAFAAHPRIGERAAAGFSSREQAGVDEADRATRDALVAGNEAYQQRFGHVFLIRAAGRTAAEMLAALRERLANEPGTELEIASEQQGEITRLRLEQLLREGHPG